MNADRQLSRILSRRLNKWMAYAREVEESEPIPQQLRKLLPTRPAPPKRLFNQRQLSLGSAIEPQLPSYALKGLYASSNHDSGYPYKLHAESFQQRS